MWKYILRLSFSCGLFLACFAQTSYDDKIYKSLVVNFGNGLITINNLGKANANVTYPGFLLSKVLFIDKTHSQLRDGFSDFLRLPNAGDQCVTLMSNTLDTVNQSMLHENDTVVGTDIEAQSQSALQKWGASFTAILKPCDTIVATVNPPKYMSIAIDVCNLYHLLVKVVGEKNGQDDCLKVAKGISKNIIDLEAAARGG